MDGLTKVFTNETRRSLYNKVLSLNVKEILEKHDSKLLEYFFTDKQQKLMILYELAKFPEDEIIRLAKTVRGHNFSSKRTVDILKQIRAKKIPAWADWNQIN